MRPAAIGRSRGGLTTKILAVADALGNLARFILMPGHRQDSQGVEPLIKDITFGALLADKAFDNDALRATLAERGAAAVIPPEADRNRAIPCDFHIYEWRYLIERFFCKIKAFRRVATRYDKTDQSYATMIHRSAIALHVNTP